MTSPTCPLFRERVWCPDGADPWGSVDINWAATRVRLVRLTDLVAMTDTLYVHGLHADEPLGGDPYPHVVRWRDRHYLKDGHHRAVRAAIAGLLLLEARVARVPAGPDFLLSGPA